METLYNNSKWLREQYLDNKLPIREVAKLSNSTGTTVRKYLKRFNIPTRTIHDPYYRQPSNKDYIKFRNYEWLYQKYVVEHLSTEKIANSIGAKTGTILHWLRRFNIPRNNQYTGKLHPNWKGGEYFTKRTGRFYINRDKRVITRYRYIVEQIIGRKLSSKETVHHINGNRIDDRPENLYLFSSEQKHQTYHQNLIHLILSNIDKPSIDLTKTTFLIKKSNLSKNE
jgi:hypothetical protein